MFESSKDMAFKKFFLVCFFQLFTSAVFCLYLMAVEGRSLEQRVFEIEEEIREIDCTDLCIDEMLLCKAKCQSSKSYNHMTTDCFHGKTYCVTRMMVCVARCQMPEALAAMEMANGPFIPETEKEPVDTDKEPFDKKPVAEDEGQKEVQGQEELSGEPGTSEDQSQKQKTKDDEVEHQIETLIEELSEIEKSS